MARTHRQSYKHTGRHKYVRNNGEFHVLTGAISFVCLSALRSLRWYWCCEKKTAKE